MSDLDKMHRATDPDTSRAAASAHLASGANDAQRLAVLEVVISEPGLTSDEIAALAKIDRHAAGRRCPELERAGKIRRGEARVSSVGGRRGVTWWPVDVQCSLF